MPEQITPYRTITHGGGSYGYYLGRDLLSEVGAIASSASKSPTKFIVSSEPIHHLFGRRVAVSLKESTQSLFIGDGEQTKNIETVNRLIGEMLEAGARRDSLVIALGGGVVGDTAGFAASIFLRGVDLIHVPTTLLAQVDSSIGGKVAVNHERGKNLVGSFHSPRAVIADPKTLLTLPRGEMRSGLFESLKGGVIGDSSLFEIIEGSIDACLDADLGALTQVIAKSVDVKAEIVMKDEKEAGARRLLNFGHTIGHGIEAALGYKSLTHGDAVAWGMIAANAIARRRGVVSMEIQARIDDVIGALDPPTVPEVDRGEVFAAIEHDKKFAAGKRVMVFARNIGECIVVENVTEEEIRYGIDAVIAR
jgi:3-dehydroquinate synthase